MPLNIELSPQDKVALASGYNSPFYVSLLNLMEAACQRAETAHFRLDASKSNEEVRQSLAECRAMRLFFEQVQLEILTQLQHFIDEQKAKQVEINKASLSSEELAKQVLNPPLPENAEEIIRNRTF